MKKNNLKRGDLIEVVRYEGWTLCMSRKQKWHHGLRECPAEGFRASARSPHKDIYEILEGKIGLLQEIITNRLDQPVGYRILIEGKTYFCKSTIADKYLKIKK